MLGFLNCDDICMYVVNKQFELQELVFDSVYVDLQYDFTAGFVCRLQFGKSTLLRRPN